MKMPKGDYSFFFLGGEGAWGEEWALEDGNKNAK